MLGTIGRRALDLLVLFFALYAFAFVPLGRRTGLEHLLAVLETRAAKNAGAEIADAARRMTRRLLGGEAPIDARGAPVVPELPRGAPANAAVIVAPPPDAPDASL